VQAAEETSSSRRKPQSTRTEPVACLAPARAHVGQVGMAVFVDPGFRRDADVVACGRQRHAQPAA
jgi:hypothetical protein